MSARLGKGWFAVVLRACHDERVATAPDDEMVIAQQPPSQGVLFCLYEQAQQAVLSLVSVFGVARIVVVAEYGDHALGRTAQQVGGGKISWGRMFCTSPVKTIRSACCRAMESISA